MKIAVICMNEDFLQSMRLSMHFVLAQKAVNKPQYCSWMHSRSTYGDFIILDNGAPEGESISNDDLLRVANLIEADEIILPDVLRDVEATIARSTDKKLLKNVDYRHRMIVPQGADWDEWGYCLTQLCTRCRPATIGIPKWMNELPGGRYHALEIIWRRRLHWSHNIHLLGAARGFRDEMAELNMPFVRSMDTALPLALAQIPTLLIENQRASFDWTRSFSSRIAERNVVDALRLSREVRKKCTFR